MLSLLFLVCVCGTVCEAQLYMYGGPGAFRRAPPVRRSPIEALERLRAPRYYPQVEYGDESTYALPPQWTDAAAMYSDEPEDEEEYEYEAAPLYRTPLDTAYPQQFQEVAPIYGDVMRGGYAMAPAPVPQQAPFYMQRRSDPSPPPAPTSAPEQPLLLQTAPTSSPLPVHQQGVQSLVLPDQVQSSSGGKGQKEEPLFRPLHSSQRTADWPQHKSPIPMLKQMIRGGAQKKKEAADPLLDELSSLKKV